MSSLTVNEQIYLEAKLHFFRLQCLLALHVWCYVLQVHLLKSGSPCTCWVSAPSLKWKWYYTPLLFSIHHFEIIRYLLHKYFLQFFFLKNYYWSIGLMLFSFQFIFFPTMSFLFFSCSSVQTDLSHVICGRSIIKHTQSKPGSFSHKPSCKQNAVFSRTIQITSHESRTTQNKIPSISCTFYISLPWNTGPFLFIS